MADNEQQLMEYEGGAFLPYLVMKVGDPKDNIRRDIRTIFKVIVSIYPPAKFYTYLTGGLKSKVNKARQGEMLPFSLFYTNCYRLSRLPNSKVPSLSDSWVT